VILKTLDFGGFPEHRNRSEIVFQQPAKTQAGGG
jgi:hypothetical protein